jgi:hypothetical protein
MYPRSPRRGHSLALLQLKHRRSNLGQVIQGIDEADMTGRPQARTRLALHQPPGDLRWILIPQTLPSENSIFFAALAPYGSDVTASVQNALFGLHEPTRHR